MISASIFGQTLLSCVSKGKVKEIYYILFFALSLSDLYFMNENLFKMYKLEVRRVNETVSSIIYRSFPEFSELYVKLCRRLILFPTNCCRNLVEI